MAAGKASFVEGLAPGEAIQEHRPADLGELSSRKDYTLAEAELLYGVFDLHDNRRLFLETFAEHQGMFAVFILQYDGHSSPADDQCIISIQVTLRNDTSAMHQAVSGNVCR